LTVDGRKFPQIGSRQAPVKSSSHHHHHHEEEPERSNHGHDEEPSQAPAQNNYPTQYPTPNPAANYRAMKAASANKSQHVSSSFKFTQAQADCYWTDYPMAALAY